MTKRIKWNLSVHVEGGPSLSSSEDMDADAVDVVSIKVSKSSSSTVDVQPGELNEVQFLCIKSDLYDDVKYKFNDGSTDSAEVILDKDHFLTSGQLVSQFEVSPNKVKFTNSNATTDANVEVIVARSAT
jgi:hypothetical protein